jgi:Tol biopolymer transport system component
MSSKQLSLSKKAYNAWRCDPHPVWSRDHRWVAFNGRPGGTNRQVMIAYLGTELDLKNLFVKEKSLKSYD